jgi:dienelactone hydrolase
MKYQKVYVIFLIVVVIMSNYSIAKAQVRVPGLPTVHAKTSKIWRAIAPYFLPPKRFEDVYGKYRSPLIFYDGDTVKTKQEWQKRRKEIRSRWMHMMGEWPPLLKKQKLQFVDSTHKDGFTQYRVSFKWLPSEKTKGYLSVPDSGGKKPAVITVYYQPKTAIGEKFPGFDYKYRDFALQLAKRGFVTLSLGTTKTTKSRNYSLYYPSRDSAQIEPLSTLAYAAANAWYVLSKVPEVDSTRIGIMGHSYGGKWAMFASCLFDKFAAAVWSDPGIIFDESKPMANYWDPWYLGYTPPPWDKRRRSHYSAHYPMKGLYPKLREEGYNLQELEALMAPRPFLVSGGVVDEPNRWIVLNSTKRVDHLLGYYNRVAMTNRRKHSPNPRSNQIAYLFFEYFLNRNGLSVKNNTYKYSMYK